MSHDQRGCSEAGQKAFDDALVGLGELPAGSNPDLRRGEPILGVFPNVYLVRSGVAPLRFVFGQTVDVWVGPFSEAVVIDVTDASLDLVRGSILRVLRSSVLVSSGRWTTTIVFQIGDELPWSRLRVRARGAEGLLDGDYKPFSA